MTLEKIREIHSVSAAWGYINSLTNTTHIILKNTNAAVAISIEPEGELYEVVAVHLNGYFAESASYEQADHYAKKAKRMRADELADFIIIGDTASI